MCLDLRPAVGFAPCHLMEIQSQNMRDDRLSCTCAIAGIGTDVTTDTVQEPMHLTLCMVKSPRAGPAIRTSKD